MALLVVKKNSTGHLLKNDHNGVGSFSVDHLMASCVHVLNKMTRQYYNIDLANSHSLNFILLSATSANLFSKLPHPRSSLALSVLSQPFLIPL